tara:strand:- start:1355 stop:1516 length:162 start_codon:yes stop_codon:yes gene_type:complete
MWDILDVYNMKEFLQTLIKWFKCKFCCASECSVGQDSQEEQLEINYNKRRKSV